MAAVSYKFCKVKKFTSISGYYKPVQLTLEGMEEEAECKFQKTETEYSYTRDNLSVKQLDIISNEINQIPDQIIVNLYKAYVDIVVNKKGKVFHEIFYKYLEPNEFIIYYVKEINIFIFGSASKDAVNQFIDYVNTDKNSGLELEPIEVDFKALQPLIPVIIGVWFGDMNKQYLKTAGYFGNHVDRSKEFTEAIEGKAKISQLLFNYEFKNEFFTVAVTRKGAVVLYSRIKDEKTKTPDIQSEIQLALQIFINFILPGIQ